MLIRQLTLPLGIAAVLVTAVLPPANSETGIIQRAVSSSSLFVPAEEEARLVLVGVSPLRASQMQTGESEKISPEEDANAKDDGGSEQDLRASGEEAGQAALEALVRGWEQTKDVAREAGELLANATDEADDILAGVWQQTKEQAQRVGEALEEVAPDADRMLGSAWEHTKDAARRAGEAWSGTSPDEGEEKVPGEVNL